MKRHLAALVLALPLTACGGEDGGGTDQLTVLAAASLTDVFEELAAGFEEEHEVELTQERVVVEKETVPVERVRVGKDTVTEEQQVNEEVRKEQIEADTDVTGTTGTTGGRGLDDGDRR